MLSFLAPTPKELGHLIRGYRKQRKWTQAQLAQQAGLLPKTLSAIEAGTGHVLLANVMRCLSALEVDLYLASRPRVQTKAPPHQTQVVEPPRPGAKKGTASRVEARKRDKPRTLPDGTAASPNKALKEPW